MTDFFPLMVCIIYLLSTETSLRQMLWKEMTLQMLQFFADVAVMQILQLFSTFCFYKTVSKGQLYGEFTTDDMFNGPVESMHFLYF